MDSISEKHIQNGKLQVTVILVLGSLTVFSALFALGIGSSSNLDFISTLKFIFGIFNISEFHTNSFSAVIFFFIFATIILVPVNSILLSTKLYKYELTVKIIPVVLFTIALYFFRSYDIQTIYTYITIATWFELIIAVSILIYKRYDIRKTNDNPFV